MKPLYSPGAKGDCMRCGFTYKLTQIRKEWTGLRVCPECRDPRPDDRRTPQVRPEGLVKPNAAPPPVDEFVTANELTREML